MKLATVAPDNPALGHPRIHGLYVLLDRTTLAPQVLMDGTALTNLRTPAVSAVAAKHLAAPGARHLVVFGSGPQAWGHVQTLRTVRPLESVTVVGRDPGRAERLAEAVAASGLRAETGTPDSVADADLVACATTAAEPLFDSDLLKRDCCVVAVGSHLPHQREVDARLLARAAAGGGAVVETRDVALREAGDVVVAIEEGTIHADRLTELAAVVRRQQPPPGGLSFFKSVGMGWQDLVVAEAAFRRWRG
jgi:ornithine cyclodeaminase